MNWIHGAATIKFVYVILVAIDTIVDRSIQHINHTYTRHNSMVAEMVLQSGFVWQL